MKHHFLYFTLFLLALTAMACAPIEDDIFTTARVTVTAGDETVITRVQAQAKLTNVNTRQVLSSADFEGPSVTIELLRGAYQIDIEGVVTCQQSDGQTHIRQFRCQRDYAEFIHDDINDITLNIIFLD